MAIPIGKTGRQLAAIARWVLAGVVVVGMLTWWWPEYRTWGAMTVGLLVVWVLWLIWRTVTGDRTVPGHPVHLALLGPAVVLTVHLAWTGLGTAPREPELLGGGINMSMICQLALLSLGILLTQGLLPQAASHAAVLSVCGAAMVGGMGLAVASGRAEQARTALTLLGFAGVCVWLSPLCGHAGAETIPAPHSRRRGLRALYLCVALGAVCAMACVSPRGAALAGCVVGGVLLLVLIARLGRWAPPIAFAAMLLTCLGVLAFRGRIPGLPDLGNGWQRLYGRGEEAFKDVAVTDNGMVVLLATVGWGGAVWLLLGLVPCLLCLIRGVQRGKRADRARATLWAAATALSTAALLSPGGLVLPAVTLAAAFTWGLLPTMVGREARPRTGVVLLFAMLAVDLLLGLARSDGLISWITYTFHGTDSFLHAVVGFLLALVMAWLTGSRSARWGLVGIALSALAGGGGELLQGIASRRRVEFEDWAWHAVGCALAVLPYLLAVGSRWCESSDAREHKMELHEACGGW